MIKIIGHPFDADITGWLSYQVTRPITTRSGLLPGQRAERPLSVDQRLLWLSDLEFRGVRVTFDETPASPCFLIYWPSIESYDFRDVERFRVNWRALLDYWGLRAHEPQATGTVHLLPGVSPLALLPLVFVDTETTGVSAEDRVIELCCQDESGAGKVWRFDPEGKHSSEMAFSVHGITDRELIGEPVFEWCLTEILEWLDGRVIVGHNVGFDVRLLKQEFARCGLDWVPLAQVDTVKLSRRLYPELTSHKLGLLADRLGIAQHGAHTARGDVDTLRALWRCLCQRLPKAATLKDLL